MNANVLRIRIYLLNSSKRVTIADVAKAAGVSTGTVSRVLNGREGEIKISASTQKHVLEVVEELGYQRNLFCLGIADATDRRYRCHRS